MGSACTCRPLTACDRDRLKHLCRDCKDFFECVEGQPGGREAADELLGPLPSTLAGTKHVLGVERDGALIGVVELLAGYPTLNTWCVGLFLLRPDVRGAGAGTALWQELRPWMIQEGAMAARLIAQKQNPSARRFWERQGFRVEKELLATAGRLESQAWLMTCSLAPQTPPSMA